MITPKDIETKEFTRTKVGGYKQEEVDDFLDELMENYSDVINERDSLAKKVAMLQDKLNAAKDEQEQLRVSMASSQRSYDESMSVAKKKADRLVADAEGYARKLIEAAKDEADRQNAIKEALTTEVESFKAQLLTIYESHVQLISQIPVIKKDTPVDTSSETLDMLKLATSDYEAEPEETEVKQEEQPVEEEDSTILVPKPKIDLNKKLEKIEEDDDFSYNPKPSKKKYDDEEEEENYSYSQKKQTKKSNDFEDEDEETDDKIKDLFDSTDKKKKKPLFGFGKKKHDDDDDDDDFDDDDDE